MSEIAVSCEGCGSPMVERINSINGSRFLGCSDFPRCERTQKVPAYLEVLRSGGIELPGFGTEDQP